MKPHPTCPRLIPVPDGEPVPYESKHGWYHFPGQPNTRIEGSALVDDNAHVLGNARVSGCARVYGNARVFDNARVSGCARVGDNASVFGDTRVYGNAFVFGDTRVYGNASVSGNASVFGDTRVYGNACVSGNARVYDNACVFGNARVYDNACVSGDGHVTGNARVYGNAHISSGNLTGEALLSSGPGYHVCLDGPTTARVGCKSFKREDWFDDKSKVPWGKHHITDDQRRVIRLLIASLIELEKVTKPWGRSLKEA